MSTAPISPPADTAILIRARHDDLGFDALADAELVDAVAQHLAVPREQPADSFVLHAPLELTARASLLPFVRPEGRARARLRLTSLLDGYERTGPGVTPRAPATDAAYASIEAAASALVGALDEGDLGSVDDAAGWLGRRATAAQLRDLLSAAVLPRLAAAAHAPIFLYHLPRVAPRGEITGELLRGLARELARQPEWRLHWIDEPRDAAPRRVSTKAGSMFEALASTPSEPAPERFFIFPTMAHVDQNGTAATLLHDVTDPRDLDGPEGRDVVAARGREVLRAAAWSMLLEPDDHAPYGWSHCLTLPQAALAAAPTLARPTDALAVAATYVVGFRSSLARRPLVPTFAAPDPHLDLRQALDDRPELAAAAVWHAADPRSPAIVSELATHAATQHDAHLVKYTLACIDAAADDPAHARLFLAAAAHLNGWWIRHGNPDDPFTR